jgi:cell division protein FtsL
VRPSQRPAEAERGLAIGALELGRGLFGHRALDRLIRGRVWIALIAFALIGIVTLQLLILQLNASIGRSLVREGQLQRSNAALSVQDSELASGERVESEAERLGMELVPESSLRFLGSDPHADVARAAAALRTPVHTSSSASGEAGSASTADGTSASYSSSGATGASGEQAATTATPQPGEAQPGSTGEAASTATATATGTPSAAASTPTGSAGTESTAGTSAGSATGAAATPTEQAPAGGSGVLSAAGGTQSTGAG